MSKDVAGFSRVLAEFNKDVVNLSKKYRLYIDYTEITT